MNSVRTPLPIDAHVDAIVEHVRRHRTAIVVAPPGSGKTTRVPPALSILGSTIVLQPRRVAARSLARRIAFERKWTLGEEVGWQIRFEKRFSTKTRLLVATEGILTARLQEDPLLSAFRVIVLDEFHERSIHGDLALALGREAFRSRDDLALVVMSATIDPAPISRYLDEARLFHVDARTHPVTIEYRAGATVSDAVREITRTNDGHVLAFLPGAREIGLAAGELATLDANVIPLHGSLEVEEQERALAPSSTRKVILATNVAETSLTVEGVTAVIDSGLHKTLRYDDETGVDHLVTEMISTDSADQRAGRAGRVAPGRAWRLWDARAILRPAREPEIRRIDLAATALEIIAWGGDPRTFPWFEPPDGERLERAMQLLTRLGAVEAGRLTPLGERMQRFPLHPRLACLVATSGGDRTAVRIAVALSEDVRTRRARVDPPTTTSDAFALADGVEQHPVTREIDRLVQAMFGRRAPATDEELRRALFSAYPDRVAMRREHRDTRFLLASGSGATLARESGVRDAEFIVALQITGSGAGEPLIRIASAIERDWLEPTHRQITHALRGDRVRATAQAFYDAIPLFSTEVEPDAVESQRLQAEAMRARIDPQLIRRAAFAGVEIDWSTLPPVLDADPASLLSFDVRKRLDAGAPRTIDLPSGRTARLEYRDDGSVFAAVKLQELFGMAESPRVGPQKVPVTFELLAPNGRPVQTTRDLRNFWNTTYSDVRKELRGRYPKHPWPEDPWTAVATHRTKRR